MSYALSDFDHIPSHAVEAVGTLELGDLPTVESVRSDALWSTWLSEVFEQTYVEVPKRFDRSHTLQAFAYAALEAGWTDEQAIVAVFDMADRWGAYYGRMDRTGLLSKMVDVARSKVGYVQINPEDIAARFRVIEGVEKPVQRVIAGATRFNAVELMAMDLPKLHYIVPGIIPEGLTVLAASPKIGKSWMVLGLAIAISNGEEAFGYIPTGRPRPVLYLSLEDGKRRLQDRLRSIGNPAISPLLEFDIAPADPMEEIKAFVSAHAGQQPLVILDTLGRVMSSKGNNDTQYGHDYKVLSTLKAATDADPGSSLLIVHHTTKAAHADFLGAVSGTQGIAGAADTVLVIKRDRNNPEAVLMVTSRDAAEGEYAMHLSDEGVWSLMGDDLEQSGELATGLAVKLGLGGPMTDVVEVVQRHPNGISPKDVAAATGQSMAATYVYLKRAVDAERIVRAERGLYTPVSNERSVRNTPPSITSYITNTPLRTREDHQEKEKDQ